ncbi:hypothetical protein [Anaerolinea sp.]|uniref:hypothetical protein n=1 Tax=Anaerolinea sp. TaxID=1872519 RepID=UPI002ACE66DC|nr:hypothetical protein [Anaerolinea sp.]
MKNRTLVWILLGFLILLFVFFLLLASPLLPEETRQSLFTSFQEVQKRITDTTSLMGETIADGIARLGQAVLAIVEAALNSIQFKGDPAP